MKKTKEQRNQKKGITLIALVITVIVLLLLAGVSITMLTGNNNLIVQSARAKDDNEIAKIIEETRIDIMGVQTENNGNISWEDLKGALIKHFINVPEEKPEDITEMPPLETSNGEYKIPLTEIYNGSIDGKKNKKELPSTEGTKPYFPAGVYSQVPGTDLNKGLVITDKLDEDGNSIGNEFVWVEVPNDGTGPNYEEVADSTDYEKIENALIEYATIYRESGYEDSFDDENIVKNATGLTEEQYYELKQKMLTSIYENGGFYVGRYETGIDIENGYRDYGTEQNMFHEATQTPVIKPNVYPYSWVNCSQSQQLSQKFSEGIGEYKSSLLFGVQWDLILKYIEEKEVAKQGESNREKIQESIKVDSTEWGNDENNVSYITKSNVRCSFDLGVTWERYDSYSKNGEEKSVLLTTGACEDFSKQNIYDIAGNVREWTLEYNGHIDHPCSYRGGGFLYKGSKYSANARYTDGMINGANYNLGFRVTIF